MASPFDISARQLSHRHGPFDQESHDLVQEALTSGSVPGGIHDELPSLIRLVTTLRAENEQLRAKLRASNDTRQRNSDRGVEPAKKRVRELERQLEEVLDAVAQIHRRELRAWKESSNARFDAISLENDLKRRLGAILVACGRSPYRWLSAPRALWREFRRPSAECSQALQRDEECTPPIAFNQKAAVSLPLTLRVQQIAIPPAARYFEVWARAVGVAHNASSTIEVNVVSPDTDATQFAVAPSNVSHRAKRESVITLKGGAPVKLLKVAAGSRDLILQVRRTRGVFCLLSVEVRDPVATSKTKYSGSQRSEPKGLLETPSNRGPKVSAPSETARRTGSAVKARVAAPRRFKAAELEKRLWRGFARYAIPALEEIKMDRDASLTERLASAWYLSRWFYVEQDYARSLENLKYARAHQDPPEARIVLAEVQCLNALGRVDEAAALTDSAIANDLTSAPDFRLYRATLIRKLKQKAGAGADETDFAQLDAVNELYVQAGLAKIEKRDPAAPLKIWNITATAAPTDLEQRLKVSVIMPAFNAESTIEWAIDSVLAQTWRNLEVIVVDDLSTDGTASVVERLAARDPRVRLIRRDVNGGAYPSRNTGLAAATGDLITVHDTDDWSHPQKIERHVEALVAVPSRMAVLSYWVRVTEDLEALGTWIPRGSLFDINLSSLMFKREVLQRTGGWDNVRVSGDAEFHSRLLALYGDDAVLRLPQELLLSFALTREDSLTRSKATHLRSLFYGVRGSYRDSYRIWHDTLSNASDGEAQAAAIGKYPIPVGNLPRRVGKHAYDFVVIADFALYGGAFVSTLNYILAACKLGKRVAVFHWRKYDLAPAQLNPRIYQACLEHGVDILNPGDEVDAEYVLIGYPAILQHRIDPAPAIQTKQVVVVINQFSSRLVDGGDEQYDPRVARAHLMSMFGTEGVWIPISAWVKRLMNEDGRYPKAHESPWFPMIDASVWCKLPPRWRGNDRPHPVVGRHGRDAYTKWPTTATALRQAYGVDAPWEVRILGGAAHAFKVLGHEPRNWQVTPFDSLSVFDFLADLDFFVHYPHEQYIEEFGRAILEAMAVGVPVVLAPQFKETFGDAALYAEPSEVVPTISALWASEKRYLERVRIGREFVIEHCDLASFDSRLKLLRGNL